jgi:GNAT superfamily N-acetyltransferase
MGLEGRRRQAIHHGQAHTGGRLGRDRRRDWNPLRRTVESRALNVVKLVSPTDTARLQHLLERCSDYYELHEGWPTPADAGEYELTFVPPGRPQDDLSLLALEDDGGTLHAVAQLLRDCPKPGTLWIALLVVAPELRGQGLGSVLLRHVTEAAAADGVTAIWLSVSVKNPSGARFWEAEGFRPTGETHNVTARSGHADTGRFMTRAISAAADESPARQSTSR